MLLPLQGSSGVQNAVPAKVAFRSLEDWVALDSGNSFAWSAQQHGSHREQLDVLRKLIEQQQQVQCRPAHTNSCGCVWATPSRLLVP